MSTFATCPFRFSGTLWIAAAFLVALPTGSAAQTPSRAAGAAGFQLVQRVDEVLFGVDPASLRLIENRFVAGTLVRVNLHVPSPVIGYTRFVADCQAPMRMAFSQSALASGDKNVATILSPRGTRNDALQLDSMEFAGPKVLDGTWFVAEFVCGSSRQPGSAVRLARELYEKGGPADLQSVFCDMQIDGGGEVRRAVEIRYSEVEDVVAVGQQWLSSGFVTEREIVFGSGGVQWIMDRQTLQARLMTAGGKTLFASQCGRQAGSGQ